MADIALTWGGNHVGDIAASAADLNTDEGLQTAVIISLFTDRRVSADEELPAGEVSRRGWWGDVASAPGDFTGSRLWLLHREKQLSTVVTKARDYAREALQWLIDDKVAARVDVIAEATQFQRLDIQVSVSRPSGQVAKFRYNYEWQAQAAKITN